MIIDIPDRYIPHLLTSGVMMGQGFSNAAVGVTESLLIARMIIEMHPDDLEQYLADFLYGIKIAEKDRGEG